EIGSQIMQRHYPDVPIVPPVIAPLEEPQHNGPFDLAYCSFALHHLSPAVRTRALEAAFEVLAEHGLLAIVVPLPIPNRSYEVIERLGFRILALERPGSEFHVLILEKVAADKRPLEDRL